MMEIISTLGRTVKMDIEETCKKLDSLCLEELEIMEEYVHSKIELEKLMKAGFLNIAKARYIMGKTSVSSLQLPTEDSELTSLCKVILDGNNSTEERKFQLMSNIKEKTAQVDGVTPSIRKRVVSDDNNQLEEKISAKFSTSDFDPLRWFGVLVPQNLRQAQTDFHSALPLVIECANLQLKLYNVCNKYEETLRKKQGLSET